MVARMVKLRTVTREAMQLSLLVMMLLGRDFWLLTRRKAVGRAPKYHGNLSHGYKTVTPSGSQIFGGCGFQGRCRLRQDITKSLTIPLLLTCLPSAPMAAAPVQTARPVWNMTKIRMSLPTCFSRSLILPAKVLPPQRRPL